MRVVRYAVRVIASKAVPYATYTLLGFNARKPVFGGLQTTDLKVKTSLVSAFVICLFESIISKLTPSEISLL